VIGDFAFEAAIVAQIGPSVARHLISFIGSIPIEVGAAWGMRE
jgi:hypothetical protein